MPKISISYLLMKIIINKYFNIKRGNDYENILHKCGREYTQR